MIRSKTNAISRLGIASCAVAITALFVFLVTSNMSFHASLGDEGSSVNFTLGNPLGLPILVGVSAALLLGLGLGVAGLRRDPRERITPVLGILLNLFFAVAFAFFLSLEWQNRPG